MLQSPGALLRAKKAPLLLPTSPRFLGWGHCGRRDACERPGCCRDHLPGDRSQSMALVCLCREPALPPAPPCTCALLVPLGPMPPELLVPVGDAGAAPEVGWAVRNKSPSGFGRGMQGRHLSDQLVCGGRERGLSRDRASQSWCPIPPSLPHAGS